MTDHHRPPAINGRLLIVRLIFGCWWCCWCAADEPKKEDKQQKLKKITIDVLIEELAKSKQYTVESETPVAQFIELIALDNELTDADECYLFYPTKIRNLTPTSTLKAYNFRPNVRLSLPLVR